MKDQILKLKEKALQKIRDSGTLDSLKILEKKYLGRKGELTKVLREIKDVSQEIRGEIGQFANQAKQELETALKETEKSLEELTGVKVTTSDWLDVTLPTKSTLGHLHPLSLVQYELEDIFSSLGFMILDGPELESEYYNFEALNIPKDHPARDIQDTFYIKSEILNPKSETNFPPSPYGGPPEGRRGITRPPAGDLPQGDRATKSKISNSKLRLVLRTHTSNLQVRAMQEYGVPIRAIFPGRVFRYEATDASHDTTFNQVEGLLVDENISIANFKAVVETFLSQIFKHKIKTRLRPGYFPFVEPGFEVDLNCEICQGQGCAVCKHSGWVEFMGAGMVHPVVLKNGGVNPKKYTGFAFGFGITRLVMMKYKINDIRLLLGSDLRFLNQF